MERIKNIQVEDLPLADLGLPTEWQNNNTALFNCKDSLILLDYCQKHNIAVLGFDGFEKEGHYIIPRLDYIADFSELSKTSREHFIQESIAASVYFINSIPKKDMHILFEFVLS